VRRQCARSGCSAIAAATFTFDARQQTVWLDPPREGNARAGELCERHANALVPPQGWQLDDRRHPEPAAIPAPEPVAATRPLLAPQELPPALEPEPEPDDIDALLVARSPLLSRAFEAAGNY